MEPGAFHSQRWYDPVSRQFLSKDPLRADGEGNAYQYCGGDPVGKVDPSGEGPEGRGCSPVDILDDWWKEPRVVIGKAEYRIKLACQWSYYSGCHSGTGLGYLSYHEEFWGKRVTAYAQVWVTRVNGPSSSKYDVFLQKAVRRSKNSKDYYTKACWTINGRSDDLWRKESANPYWYYWVESFGVYTRAHCAAPWKLAVSIPYRGTYGRYRRYRD